MSVFRKIRNMIRWGSITNPGNDSGKYTKSQIKYMFKTKNNIIFMYPYGTSGKPPIDTLSVILNVGDEDDVVALSLSGDGRTSGKINGEFEVGNFVKGTRIYFHDNGDISIQSKGKTIIHSDLEVRGDISATNVNASADVTAGAISLSSHTHGGVTPGPGFTGPPV